MSYPIIKKFWRIDFDQIEDGFLYSGVGAYAESRNKAKTALLHEVRYEGLKNKRSLEELTYLTIPVFRSEQGDIVLFEGQEVKRWKIESILSQRKRFAELDAILNNPDIQYCYIRKRGTYYAPNSNGYTDYKFRAGVYTKEEAIQDAKSCNELSIVPIDIEEHNSALNKMIEDIKSRLIVKEATTL